MAEGDACIRVRKAIMNECFRGGDAKHRAKWREHQNGRENCDVIMWEKKCDTSDLCEE